MLKLSTKSSYGLRACLTLAGSDKLLSSAEIAEKDGIPRRYLEQILSSLKNSGLVKSVRGARGGYTLGRPAQEITIADLVKSVEGALPPMLCSNPDLQSDTCRSDSECDCRGLCNELESSVARVLDSTNLADILAQRSQQKSLNHHMTGDAQGKLSKQDLALTSTSPENNKR